MKSGQVHSGQVKLFGSGQKRKGQVRTGQANFVSVFWVSGGYLEGT